MKRLLPICAALLLALTACTPPAEPSPGPGGVQTPRAAESPVPSQGLTVRTDWSKPVSYTHLDVYKRQALFGPRPPMGQA